MKNSLWENYEPVVFMRLSKVISQKSTETEFVPQRVKGINFLRLLLSI